MPRLVTKAVGKPGRDYNPQDAEKRVLDHWHKTRAYLKTKRKLLNRPKFYFLDGPPYVNAAPHVGTAWNKTLKDTIIRYWRTKGYNVRDQPGYDCHGLPVEVMVEILLKLTNKKEIEEVDVLANFINKCKEYAADIVEIQPRVLNHSGVLMDWPGAYV